MSERPNVPPPTTMEGMWQLLDYTDQKHDEAHRRLRQDLNKLEGEVTAGLQSVRDTVTALKVTPVDATKLVMTPGVVAGIVAIVLTIAGSWYASTSRSGSDTRDLLTRMESLQRSMDARDKLQDVQNQAIKASVDDMKRRMELQQYELQELSKTVLRGGRSPR